MSIDQLKVVTPSVASIGTAHQLSNQYSAAAAAIKVAPDPGTPEKQMLHDIAFTAVAALFSKAAVVTGSLTLANAADKMSSKPKNNAAELDVASNKLEVMEMETVENETMTAIFKRAVTQFNGAQISKKRALEGFARVADKLKFDNNVDMTRRSISTANPQKPLQKAQAQLATPRALGGMS